MIRPLLLRLVGCLTGPDHHARDIPAHQHGPTHRFTAGDGPPQLRLIAEDTPDRLEDLPPGEQLALIVDELCLLTATALDIRDMLHDLVKHPATEGSNTQ